MGTYNPQDWNVVFKNENGRLQVDRFGHNLSLSALMVHVDMLIAKGCKVFGINSVNEFCSLAGYQQQHSSTKATVDVKQFNKVAANSGLICCLTKVVSFFKSLI